MAATLIKAVHDTDYPGGQPYPTTTHPEADTSPVTVQKIGFGDLRAALREGVQDWLACRTDVLVMVVIYPLAALFIAIALIDRHFLPLLFPVASGMALVGPVATIWFGALSRQRERDGVATVDAAGAIFESPRGSVIKRLALLLIGLFAVWIAVAGVIYHTTLGSAPGTGSFLHGTFATAPGHEMILIGVLVGAVFGVVALATALVSFQLALDHEIGVAEAVSVSVQAALANPGVTLIWGLLIAGLLLIGAIPGLIGLAVTIPILGHSAWHLYRRMIRNG